MPTARAFLLLAIILAAAAGAAVSHPHVISFGPWTTVRWNAGADPGKALTLKIRPLLVDARVREFTLGSPHEVTERLFVVRRVFRLNDSLPEDSGAPRWQWQRGGWLLVDRQTGRISPINLPEFDAYYSAATWYRDYVAYCGISDDGKKVYTIVAQLGHRKPVLKKPLADAPSDDAPPDSACPDPRWQREPARVTFEAPGGTQTYAVRGHVVDLVSNAEEDDEEESK